MRTTLKVEPLDHTTGVWCPACARLSAVTYTTAVHLGDALALITRSRCSHCGTVRPA